MRMWSYLHDDISKDENIKNATKEVCGFLEKNSTKKTKRDWEARM